MKIRTKPSRTLALGVSLGLMIVAGLSGCGKRPGPDAPASAGAGLQQFEVRGVVKEIKPDGVTASIQHEEIPGYMEAMTMPLRARDPRELAAIKAGDRILFRLQVNATESWIDRVRKIGEAPPEPVPPNPSTRIAREVEPLAVGDLLPSYTLTNELGRAFRIEDFRGRALAFTFIFTRCPLPDFCPRLSSQFSAAIDALGRDAAGPTNWHFLSLTFDVRHDTPAVLKAYAQRYRHDSSRWTFATGGLPEIDALTEHFGLMFSPDESPLKFNHNLRTVVVDAGGRIQQVYVGNTWKTEDLVAEMKKAATTRGGTDAARTVPREP